MKKAVIVGYARTAFAKAYSPDSPAAQAGRQGKLAKVRPDDMVVDVINGLIEQTGIDPKDVETVLTGTAFPEGAQGLNMARLAVTHPDSKLTNSTGGVTLNRFCGSSMHTIADAVAHVTSGWGDVVISTGVESMSSNPMSGWNPDLNPEIYDGNVQAYMGMGRTAENLARKYSITREAQEAFALKSHQKAAAAQAEGKFKDEIVPVRHAPDFMDDNVLQPSITLEDMAAKRPAFEKEGTVTASTSSPITDGAAGVAVTSAEYAEEHSLDVLAEVVGFAGSGCDPEIMGIGPVEATQKALDRAGLTLDDIDVIELNEAFAAQSLAVIEELGLDQDKVNIDGGAIALGHPLGASGSRITGKAAALLNRENKEYGLATMCIGGGQGVAMVLRNPNYTPKP